MAIVQSGASCVFVICLLILSFPSAIALAPRGPVAGTVDVVKT